MRAMEGTYIAEDGSRQRGLFALIWIDLFEPGSGSQVHDFNGGIQPSGLFWAVELPGDAFKVSHDGRRATLEAKDVCVLDSFQFGGPINVPARVSFKVRWEATGPRERRGQGSAVPPTDPAAFLGRFATARSTGTFSGSEVGFSFTGRGDTDRGHAQFGPERNGVFLS
jgi:hypothetical protein